jgi:hypothetical protein
MPIVEFEIEHIYHDDSRGIVLEVQLNGNDSVRFPATVDTGASYCLFQSAYADMLGLTLRDGVPLRLSPAGGGTIEAYGHEVTVTVLGKTVSSMVYFTDHYQFRRNVLGRRGWLDIYKLGIVHYQSKLYLGNVDHQ